MTTRPDVLPAKNDACWCGSGRRYKNCHRLADLNPDAVRPPAAAAVRRVRPGRVSPRRAVPPSIARPPYLATGGVPQDRGSGAPRSADVIARLRVAGRAAAEVLALAGAAVQAGVTTDELDVIVHDECIRRGGYPSPLGYRGFPKSVCTSINEVICHGIPDSTRLRDGDIINLDVTIYLDGVHGDTNATFCVGEVDETSARLVQVTRECLDLGIAAVRPGVEVRTIGAAIQQHAEAHGFGVIRDFVGHGIGEEFHGELQIPHYDDVHATRLLLPGMTFTIEPMISVGDWHLKMWDDGWTAVTADLSRTAQFEHMMVVTDDGVDVLTALH
ncbi:type I methionyl aminopeptidase [Acidothermaceae bacterium B102]|nr:type I methionyl aminopeptidase [Acidothermaceae bacterium B102]